MGSWADGTTDALEIHSQLIDLLRRDLICSHPDSDAELNREVLPEKPSCCYVGGSIVPAYDGTASVIADEDEAAEEIGDDRLAIEILDAGHDGEADEKDSSDQPPPPARQDSCFLKRPHRRASGARAAGHWTSFAAPWAGSAHSNCCGPQAARICSAAVRS